MKQLKLKLKKNEINSLNYLNLSINDSRLLAISFII